MADEVQIVDMDSPSVELEWRLDICSLFPHVWIIGVLDEIFPREFERGLPNTAAL
jgi:hypothetical protein